MKQLKDLAQYAANNTIRGGSYRRNSLLKPLDIILQELEKCPNPEDEGELALVRDGTKDMIFEHLRRIAKAEYKPGRTKESKVYKYVDLFFDEVLLKAHGEGARGVTRLLNREKLIRSAYLVYLREALAQKQADKLVGGDTNAAGSDDNNDATNTDDDRE
jgi:CRISPR-associated protein Csc3